MAAEASTASPAEAKPFAVFVCLGNICRGPAAKAVFRNLINDGISANEAFRGFKVALLLSMVLMLMLRTRKATLSLAKHRAASDLHLSIQPRQCFKVDSVLLKDNGKRDAGLKYHFSHGIKES